MLSCGIPALLALCTPGTGQLVEITAGIEGRILENTSWGESFKTSPGLQPASWSKAQVSWTIKGG